MFYIVLCFFLFQETGSLIFVGEGEKAGAALTPRRVSGRRTTMGGLLLLGAVKAAGGKGRRGRRGAKFSEGMWTAR